MNFEAENLYHIYNRGNNGQRIFFDDENYIFFLRKIRKHLFPLVDILCYCLMPNHFHILVHIPRQVEASRNDSLKVSSALAIILRSYTQAINKKYHRLGSLFQQKTKAKNCLIEDKDYPFVCFHYIHQNPLKSKLIRELSDWKYSSYLDYSGFREGTLVNKRLASKLLDIPLIGKDFRDQSKAVSTLGFEI